MSGKTKLELTWIGKENRPRLEPRILLEDPEKSYHAAQRVGENDIFDNRLIFGDNLLALKALEQEFTGRVNCIYIDPPFNTKQAFEHYDDGVEHSVWLSLMRERLSILHRLLHESGSCFIHIDDNELGYLIVLADEIFDRRNRISIITFKQSSVSGPKAVNPGLVTTSNFILYYAKDKSKWKSYKVFVPTERDDRYNRYINNIDDEFTNWNLIPLRDAFAKKQKLPVGGLKKAFGDALEKAITEFVLEDPRRVVRTARVAPKDVNEDARGQLLASQQTPGRVFRSTRPDRDDFYFLNGEQLLFYSTKTREVDGENVTAEAASNLWSDLLSNNLHKEGGVEFPKGKKPELLLKRILDLSTKPGDLVLDSFAGSGTSGAVAHKMGRRWIMVELGEQCDTHIVPRMRRVIDGTDQDGASKAVRWRGGGGFRYCTLAPSLLEKDSFGNLIISKKYNPFMLAEALCKLEGFTYAPSETEFWRHGHSTESDFIYVTTQTLTRDQLADLSERVGDKRTLLVLCTAFRAKGLDEFSNLTVKKIPKTIQHRCEWGKDDYSLEIRNLPLAPNEPEPAPQMDGNGSPRSRRSRTSDMPLFGGDDQ